MSLLLIRPRLSQSTDDLNPKTEDRQKSLGAYFRIKFRASQAKSMNKRLDSTDESRPGVFGVSLDTSIRYANIAISQFNDEGQSYVYGYIPIVIAKTGVYLKANGKYELQNRRLLAQPLIN